MSAAVADDLAVQVEELLRLWSSLSLRHVALGSSCACGMGGVSLRLEDFELDIYGYLEDVALRENDAPVKAFFTQAQQQPAASEPLRHLLLAARDGGLPPEVVAWLVPRVGRTLRSFAELHGPSAGL